MRHHLYIHLVWTTLDRAPLIDEARATSLSARLPAIARTERAHVMAMGIVATHVHLLVRIHPATSMVRLVQRLKGVSSHDLATISPRLSRLRWARGYSVETVSRRALLDVGLYIGNQATHHPAEAIVLAE